MKIIATSECPTRAARELDDLRVRLQLGDAVRACSNAVRLVAPELCRGLPLPPLLAEGSRASLWARATGDQFAWAVQHALALCAEMSVRFPAASVSRERDAACAAREAMSRAAAGLLPGRGFEPLNDASDPGLGLDFTRVASATGACRMMVAHSYRLAQRNPRLGPIATWRGGRGVPEWIGLYADMADELLRARRLPC